MGSLTADAVSLHTLFTTEGGMIGFKIPSYQRTYDWGQDNIQRCPVSRVTHIDT